MEISVVVPAYNEAANLRQLHAELAETAAKHRLQLELVLVDDGSRDGTWEAVQELAAADSRVCGIRLRKNFGKAAALTAGIRAARAPLILTMDGDLQDDPAEIPNFLAELAKGFDVVSGWKRRRLDPWHKVYPSRVFNFMVSRLTGVHLHDHNCGMKLCRAEVFREVRIYGELHRFIPVLAAARGFRVGELPINHRPRLHGRSKYGFERFLRGFLDLLTVQFLTQYGHRPQHLLGFLGMLCFGLGFLGMAWLAGEWTLRLWYPDDFAPLHQRPLLIYSLAGFFLGVQLMSIGFLAELITMHQSREEDAFSVAEATPPRAGS